MMLELPGSNLATLLDKLVNTGTETNALTAGNQDDGYWSGAALPFSFSFYGTNYTSAAVGTNGILMFGTPFTTYIPVAAPQAGYRDYITGVW